MNPESVIRIIQSFGVWSSSWPPRKPAYYPDRFLARLEDEALVAGAAGGLFAVEVFEERDGVFA